MRISRLLGMAIAAIILCVGFASCSSDDNGEEDNGGGTVTTGKLLRSMTKKDGHSTYTSTFIYNANKQLTSATSGYDGERINATWSDNSIIVETIASWKEEPATFSLEKGIVISTITGSDAETLTYDSSNHLTKISGYTNCTWSWTNGNISQFSYLDNGETLTYICTYYTDKENKHPIVDIDALRLYYVCGIEWGDLLLKAHPNLLGTTNKNLLKSVTRNDGWSRSYTYEVDSEGYPTKIVETDGGDTTYTLIWQ